MSSIGIRLPADEKEQLAAYAKANDMTVSQVVRSLIRTMRFSVSSRSDEIENQKADAKRRQTPIDRSYEK